MGIAQQSEPARAIDHRRYGMRICGYQGCGLYGREGEPCRMPECGAIVGQDPDLPPQAAALGLEPEPLPFMREGRR